MREGPATTAPTTNTVIPPGGVLGRIARVLEWVNRALLQLSVFALLGAAAVLSYSIASRHFFKNSTDWQDEFAVFSLVGATFLCSAHVQSRRGHIGIEAVAGLLSPALNRARQVFSDLFSLLFCTFFAWKSWALFHEACVEHQTTASTWGPPLALPYSFMAAGMTLLVVQLALQLVYEILRPPSPK